MYRGLADSGEYSAVTGAAHAVILVVLHRVSWEVSQHHLGRSGGDGICFSGWSQAKCYCRFCLGQSRAAADSGSSDNSVGIKYSAVFGRKGGPLKGWHCGFLSCLFIFFFQWLNLFHNTETLSQGSTSGLCVAPWICLSKIYDHPYPKNGFRVKSYN